MSSARTQRTYDHCLIGLVQQTGDATIATRIGVPRSTVAGWLRRSRQNVVSAPTLDESAAELRARLERRVRRLAAMLRVVFALMRILQPDLTRLRVPDGADKHRLLRAIERSRRVLGLRRVLSWCLNSGFDAGCTAALLIEAGKNRACADGTPKLLVDGGVENYNESVDAVVESGLLERVLAQTEISFSNSLIEAWWRVLKHQWLFLNNLDSAAKVRGLVEFYVAEHNGEIPHSAFKGETLDEMYFDTGDGIPDRLVAARAQARQTRIEENRARRCAVCD